MGRTHLTTAPGESLVDDGPGSRAERWVHGPAVPVEPSWPGRYRKLWLVLAAGIVVLGILLGYAVVNQRANSADPTFSPELDQSTP